MKAFRDYILAEIQTRLPTLKTVRMFNNQFEKSNNDDSSLNTEAAFGYPACFVELEEVEVRNVALGIKFVDLKVRLHIGIENYTKQRASDYITVDNISDAMQGMRGDEADTVQFSSMEEQTVTIDVDYNNVNRPVLEFNTTYTKLSNYKRRAFTLKSTPNTLDQTVTINTPVTDPTLTPWEEHVARSGRGYAFPMPTGQTTVYRTGDDAYIENTIFTTAIRTANSLKAINTLADFYTLNNNNAFGNINRFTDINGLQVYGDNYVIDHYTGLGWYTVSIGTIVWNDAIDNALASSQNSYTDWFLPNINQIQTMRNTTIPVYSVYLIHNGSNQTSTTSPLITTEEIRINTNFETVGLIKTATRPTVICRKHY